MRRRYLYLTGVLTVLLLSLTGCRKELCYDHDEHGFNVRAYIRPVWELEWMRDYGISTIYDLEEDSFFPQDFLTPRAGKGIACASYHESGMFTTRHIDSTGGILHLQEGLQDLLFYNNDTEYIVFNGMDTYAEASASTRTRTRATYNSTHEDETTVNPPDMLFGAWVGNYDGVLSSTADTIGIHLRPLVYKYLIVFEFTEGIELVQSASGGLAGMAGKVYMQDGHTDDETVTILFDDCYIIDNYIIAVVSSFGAPGFDYEDSSYDAAERKFGLNLTVTLNGGKTVYSDFDITDQMSIQPRGGYIFVPDISISTEGGEGFFDVSVGDWGDEEEIELPL